VKYPNLLRSEVGASNNNSTQGRFYSSSRLPVSLAVASTPLTSPLLGGTWGVLVLYSRPRQTPCFPIRYYFLSRLHFGLTLLLPTFLFLYNLFPDLPPSTFFIPLGWPLSRPGGSQPIAMIAKVMRKWRREPFIFWSGIHP
jgi:hypothetical protein